MDLSDIKRDVKSIEEGQWVEDLIGMGDIRLKVRGMTSNDVVMFRAAKERAIPRNMKDRQGNLLPKTAMNLLREVLIEKVLIDWENLTEGGTPVPYSKEKARQLLTDESMIVFADAVVQAAQIVDNGNASTQEEVSGN